LTGFSGWICYSDRIFRIVRIKIVRIPRIRENNVVSYPENPVDPVKNPVDPVKKPALQFSCPWSRRDFIYNSSSF